MAKKKPSIFRFNKNDVIGAAGAEDDTAYLSNCFIDIGELALLEDVHDHRQIILGRTGAGKSALLSQLSERRSGNVITIAPENLALTYVSNSTILNYFANIGVNLDPFFKLLWRHVLTVEILTHHFENTADPGDKSLVDLLRAFFSGASRKDKEKAQAIQYLENWGKHFWKKTEFRVKEITQTLETDLTNAAKAQLGNKYASVGGDLTETKHLGNQERTELLSRGQDIVSKAQVSDLQKVLDLIDSVLLDRQKQYYVVIGRLDEDWVEEKLRYKLIMALIQTGRDFTKVRNAKIIIALRRDLIDRVFRLTRESGFQEEKYKSFYLPLDWSQDNIIQLLDTRINRLVSRRYTKQTVTHCDLLPNRFRNMKITDYIYSVAPRPRDVIAFFNTCISAAVNKSKLNEKELKIAEGEYSRSRLRALGDEWSSDYPSLLDFAHILERRPPSFKLATILSADIGDICLNVTAENIGGTGLLQQLALRVVDCQLDTEDFKYFLIRIFYHVGLVGLKTSPKEKESWVNELGRSLSFSELSVDTSAVVHPAYRRALGIAQ